MKLSRYIYSLFLLAALIFTSCEDKLPYISPELGEGEATINAEVEFRALEPALESRAAGNAVDKINELWIVIYKVNPNGTEIELYEKVKIYDAKNNYELPGFSIDQTGNSADPSDAETVTPPSGDNVGSGDGSIGGSGQATPKAKFKLSHIPYGYYKMFAVANVDLTEVDCSTIAALRSTRFDWKTDVSLDNQMFGYYTLSSSSTSRAEAPVLTINQDNISLHSWIRRLVSKVTVSFDPSGLKESVRIYIKSVTIHDIPASCALGEKNTPDADDELIKNGESFTYYNAGQADDSHYKDWKIVISKGSGPKGETGHTEADPALYFYENMQGNYESNPKYDKRQQQPDMPDGVGSSVNEPAKDENGNLIYENGLPQNDYKDRLLYGTYIEVEAYYDSFNKDKISQGPIKYRFMLGKNSTYNYDAERNYHYKLTLKFRGWANEADWHIDYNEYTPTLLTPEPYYISYLYGQEMEFPARVKLPPTENRADYTVKAEIVENNWWPWDPDVKNADGTKGARPAQYIPDGVAGMQDISGFAWNTTAFNDIYKYVPYTKAAYEADPDNFPYGGSNYVGFLSLKPNESEIIGETYPGIGTGSDTNGYGPKANEFLQDYYKKNKLAVKTYNLSDSKYATYDDVDQSVSLKIPMYTRNKEMVPGTDFTGNNPFYAYHRFAKVRFTLWKNGEQITYTNADGKEESERFATIYQVPRIENPKAIYRDWNNDDAFEVKLMILPNAGTSTYQTFKSDGPWRASIMCQTESFIELTGRDGKKKTAVGDYITGSTDETIEFTYKPSGKLGSSNSTRCGIIKVEYNDYNCVHLIFVRQGYHKGVKLGNATWSCYNAYSAGCPNTDYKDSYGTNQPVANYTNTQLTARVALTKNPLSIGSLFKRCQYNYAIRENNNANYGWLQPVGSLKTTYIDANNIIQYRDNISWSSIWGYGWCNQVSNANSASDRYNYRWADTWQAVAGDYENGTQFAVPTAENFQSLLACSFGYGIAYADGATTTAKTYADACGFIDYDNDGVDDGYNAAAEGANSRGVRVCLVYNPDNGDNIIFPVSSMGQGRRTRYTTNVGSGTYPFSEPGKGTLSYSGILNPLYGDNNRYRPLTYNIYRNPGAIYWIKQPVVTNNKPEYASWDINFYTIVFHPYDYMSLGGRNNNNTAFLANLTAADSSDALPIKLIYKNQ